VKIQHTYCSFSGDVEFLSALTALHGWYKRQRAVFYVIMMRWASWRK